MAERILPQRDSTSTITLSGTLPADLARTVASRVGVTGLAFAAVDLSFHVLFTFLRPPGFPRDLDNAFLANGAVGISAGFALWWFSRRWAASPMRVLRLGLAFEVLASLLIGLAESAMPWVPGHSLQGHSSISFWISTFALVAPAPFGLALTHALLSAAMAPLGMAINIAWRGNPVPPLEVWAMWSAAPFLMAVICTWIGRWIYRLGVDLERVRSMGSYQLIEPLGQGGMGEVWKAEHRYLSRDAAVKLIGSRNTNTELVRKRFEREAQAIAHLECPHTVSIFDFGATPEGQLYFAMELIRGVDLEKLVKRFGPQPQERVRHILLGALRSLEEAHAAGLVHRDIKPSNILLARVGLDHDFVKVVDFGLVKVKHDPEATHLTLEQQTMGTPAYMAPELAAGEESAIDGRADLYSLGCVAYWLLTGRPVFAGPTPMAIVLKHLQEPVPPLREAMELPLDADLERLVMCCLEKNADARPASARLLRESLTELRLPSTWNEGRAAEWWQTHLPEKA